jgi:hypothetical protein
LPPEGIRNDVPVPRTQLDSIVDELYSAPREEFITLRKERAKAARAAGNTALAVEIDKLTKPTTAAWLANQLARTDAADVRALASLGDALREAHERLDGAEIKSLSHQRTELIRGLVGRAEAVSDGSLSESVTRELEEILTRSVADEDAGQALVSGRMTSAKGFAPGSGWPTLEAGERPAPAPKKAAAKDRGSDRDKARAALDAARAAVKEAEAARADDERALADAENAVEEAAAEVKRLGEELDAAEARERRARGLVGSARRAAKEAERQAAAAWKQVQQAEQRLSDLDE